MSLSTPGKSISGAEITNVSVHGIWLLTRGRELFLPYEYFPWFLDRSLKEILRVEEPAPGHFYWPDLDIDLTLEIIEHPGRFPLISKQ
ncbi:DUF2442 domain-containing protein [Myxococcota bacterium]|nr:DUF2442 domain-containing protein [Myxococcota bacterium]MBU1537316.1 DUF2442 domain-containing protein [Myxococcota bacterium]